MKARGQPGRPFDSRAVTPGQSPPESAALPRQRQDDLPGMADNQPHKLTARAESARENALLHQPKSDTNEPSSKSVCDTSQQFSVASATVSRENREFLPERTDQARAQPGAAYRASLKGASRCLS